MSLSSRSQNPKKRDSELESLLHSEHIVQIEKLIVGGDGLARIQFQDKSLVVFVPRSAPGDELKIKISHVEKNHLLGEILEIVKASNHRQKPPCAYFQDCGGCSWQHVADDEQIRQKELILKDLFHKFLPNINYTLLPTVRSEKNLRYRNRIQLKQMGAQFGYFKKSSHNIVDIEDCLLAENEISSQIPSIKSKLKPSSDLKKFELRLNHQNQFEFYPIGQDGEGLSFSQVNNFVNQQLIQTVVSMVQQKNPPRLTELYAGAGNFTFPLLQKMQELQIESVEMNSKLTQFTVAQSTQLKLQKRLFAFTSDCESFAERRALSSDFVLLDPPRSGTSDVVLNKILQTSPQNILYISCHPVFLARDLKKMLEKAPQYQLQHLQIFDMFPQTDHFETVVLLSSNRTN